MVDTIKSTSLTSVTVNKILRQYKHYVQDCLRDIQPIMHINRFYRQQRRLKEIEKSRVYDKYLNKVKQDVPENP